MNAKSKSMEVKVKRQKAEGIQTTYIRGPQLQLQYKAS